MTADLVCKTTKPISPQLLRNVEIEEVTHSIQTRFATMAFSDSEMSLISVKAVDSSFPLKGDMVLFDGENRRDVVEPNELWLDERLFSLLAVNIGDVVSIGDLDLNVSGVIEKEPGISFNPFQQMPSALISSTRPRKYRGCSARKSCPLPCFSYRATRQTRPLKTIH